MEPSTTEARIEELQGIRKQINLCRGGTAGIVVLTLAVSLGLLYRDAKALTTQGPEQRVFVDKLQAGMNESVVPRLQETASRTLSEMQPVVQKEFVALNQRVPDVTKATLDQMQTLQVSLPEITSKALTETFDKALRGRDAEVRKMFPNATDEQVKTLFDNLTKVTNEHGRDFAERLLSSHVSELDGIQKNLRSIAATEPKTGNDTDDWQLGLAVFDVVRDDVKDLTLPKGKAANMIVEAAGSISKAAKEVSKTADDIAKKAKEEGKK